MKRLILFIVLVVMGSSLGCGQYFNLKLKGFTRVDSLYFSGDGSVLKSGSGISDAVARDSIQDISARLPIRETVTLPSMYYMKVAEIWNRLYTGYGLLIRNDSLLVTVTVAPSDSSRASWKADKLASETGTAADSAYYRGKDGSWHPTAQVLTASGYIVKDSSGILTAGPKTVNLRTAASISQPIGAGADSSRTTLNTKYVFSVSQGIVIDTVHVYFTSGSSPSMRLNVGYSGDPSGAGTSIVQQTITNNTTGTRISGGSLSNTTVAVGQALYVYWDVITTKPLMWTVLLKYHYIEL